MENIPKSTEKNEIVTGSGLKGLGWIYGLYGKKKPSELSDEEKINNSTQGTATSGEGGVIVYYGGAIITGILVFVGVWIYAMSEWGFLIGITLGWIPALIAGLIGGFLWPLLVAIIVLWLIIAFH